MAISITRMQDSLSCWVMAINVLLFKLMMTLMSQKFKGDHREEKCKRKGWLNKDILAKCLGILVSCILSSCLIPHLSSKTFLSLISAVMYSYHFSFISSSLSQVDICILTPVSLLPLTSDLFSSSSSSIYPTVSCVLLYVYTERMSKHRWRVTWSDEITKASRKWKETTVKKRRCQM